MAAAALTSQVWRAAPSLCVFVLHYWNVYSLSERRSKLAALRSNTLLTERSPGKYSNARWICISKTARSFFLYSFPSIWKNGSLLTAERWLFELSTRGRITTKCFFKKKNYPTILCATNTPPALVLSFVCWPNPPRFQHGRPLFSMHLPT